MIFQQKEKREMTQISAGSMADIAFLLLIFFLVTTSINEDKGLLVLLPRWQPIPISEVYDQELTLTVKLNAADELLVEGERMNIDHLRENAKRFLLEKKAAQEAGAKKNLPIVSLTHDRSTTYNAYIGVYNELKAAYREIRNEVAHKWYGQPFEDITETQKRKVKEYLPMVISEAEPVNYDKEG